MAPRRLRNKRLQAALTPHYAAGARFVSARCVVGTRPRVGRQFRQLLSNVAVWLARNIGHVRKHPAIFRAPAVK